MTQDPVHYHENGSEPNHDCHKWNRTGWYFWDETWANREGPFYTEEAARKALSEYASWLNGGDFPQ